MDNIQIWLVITSNGWIMHDLPAGHIRTGSPTPPIFPAMTALLGLALSVVPCVAGVLASLAAWQEIYEVRGVSSVGQGILSRDLIGA